VQGTSSIHQYVNSILHYKRRGSSNLLNKHIIHIKSQRERRKKRNRIKERRLTKKKMEKQKPQFSTVILSSGEEYENYTHTFQTKPTL
jgi:hypothetical protein